MKMTLFNSKGDRILVDDQLTIGELVKHYGLREIKMEPIGSKIPEGWWANKPPHVIRAKKKPKKKKK